LAFINGKRDFVEAVENEAFYSIQLNLERASMAIKGSSLSIHDIVAAGVFTAAKGI
jgi:hypothetical protein